MPHVRRLDSRGQAQREAAKFGGGHAPCRNGVPGGIVRLRIQRLNQVCRHFARGASSLRSGWSGKAKAECSSHVLPILPDYRLSPIIPAVQTRDLRKRGVSEKREPHVRVWR